MKRTEDNLRANIEIRLKKSKCFKYSFQISENICIRTFIGSIVLMNLIVLTLDQYPIELDNLEIYE